MSVNRRHPASDSTSSAEQTAHARKPDSPVDLDPTSWKYVVRRAAREFSSDQCTDLAAALTFFAVLAIFPALIALVSLLGIFGRSEQSIDALLAIAEEVVPESTVDVLRGPIEQFTASTAAGFALVAGIIVAVWSASGYVGAFSRAMNRIWEIQEGRSFIKLRAVQLAVTVITLVLIAIMAVLLAVSGPVADALGDAWGVGDSARIAWAILKWPVIAAAAIVIIAVLYFATPNAKQPKFRWMSMGAALALATLVLASLLFGIYVANFANYDRVYGSLAGVIVFLLWLWIANIALLFGAEFDAELERGRQLQAGIAAEEEIQLPPRDETKIIKNARKSEQDIADGRRIRESHHDTS